MLVKGATDALMWNQVNLEDITTNMKGAVSVERNLSDIGIQIG